MTTSTAVYHGQFATISESDSWMYVYTQDYRLRGMLACTRSTQLHCSLKGHLLNVKCGTCLCVRLLYFVGLRVCWKATSRVEGHLT